MNCHRVCFRHMWPRTQYVGLYIQECGYVCFVPPKGNSFNSLWKMSFWRVYLGHILPRTFSFLYIWKKGVTLVRNEELGRVQLHEAHALEPKLCDTLSFSFRSYVGYSLFALQIYPSVCSVSQETNLYKLHKPGSLAVWLQTGFESQ